jgi:hypothetical protein
MRGRDLTAATEVIAPGGGRECLVALPPFRSTLTREAGEAESGLLRREPQFLLLSPAPATPPSSLSAPSAGTVWLPTDDRLEAHLTDDEPPELAFYCPDCAEREFGELCCRLKWGRDDSSLRPNVSTRFEWKSEAS